MIKLKVYDPTGGGSATNLSKENLLTNPTIKDMREHSLLSRGRAIDLNNVLDSGVVLVWPDSLNKPEQYMYGMVLTLLSFGYKQDNNGNWAWQICFSTGSASFWIRKKVNDGAWEEWYRFDPVI